MHNGLHAKSDADRRYVSRKEGGRWLLSFESTIATEENNLGWYLKMDGSKLKFAWRSKTRQDSEVQRERESVSKKGFKKSLNEKMVENWKEK